MRRIRTEEVVTLHAGEHTAQIPNAVRATLESEFKAPPAESKVNVLACSPTLEMGIDVGGLDAVVLRNCEKACYRCLKSYANQRIHEKLRWPLAVPMLEALAGERPAPQPREVGDIDDPRPWLEAYTLGLGSPLELRFWRLFEQNGFLPEKQVPVAPSDGEAPISIADFAVPERRLVVYVDGATFHVGANLRRDRYIRERLRGGNPPWRVEELRAADLALGAALVGRLRAEAPRPAPA